MPTADYEMIRQINARRALAEARGFEYEGPGSVFLTAKMTVAPTLAQKEEEECDCEGDCDCKKKG